MTPKIFLGFLNKGELSMHAHQLSGKNKQEWLMQNPFEKGYFQEQEYLGFFLSNCAPLDQLKEKKQQIREQLALFFPKLNVERVKLYLFPQIFIS